MPGVVLAAANHAVTVTVNVLLKENQDIAVVWPAVSFLKQLNSLFNLLKWSQGTKSDENSGKQTVLLFHETAKNGG